MGIAKRSYSQEQDLDQLFRELEGNLDNSNVSPTAAIAYSKLNLASSITSNDIVDGTIVNADVNASAAIAYSKLNLASSIVNADISSSAAIAISKTTLGTFTTWADYTPTLSVAAGTAPTYTAHFVSRWMQLGKMVTVQWWWANSAGGTAGSGGAALLATLPVSSAQVSDGSILTFGSAQVYNGAAAACWTVNICGAASDATKVQFVIADTVSYANIAGGNQNNVSRGISGVFSYEVA